jgi:hypothetical protein
MPSTQKIIEQVSIKQTVVKAIITRLKPNIYISSSHYWGKLERGLSKMTIEEIDALEALIMGKQVIDDNTVLSNSLVE